MARAALRDDLHAVHAQLTAQVLRATDADEPAPARIADWEEGDAVVVAGRRRRSRRSAPTRPADLARLSVGLRVVRRLLSS